MSMIAVTNKWGRDVSAPGPVAPRDNAPGALDTIVIRLVVSSSLGQFPRRLQGQEES
jgi:hypothetical protein